MKPTLAWALVDAKTDVLLEAHLSRRYAEWARGMNERLVRVEIREVEKPKKGKR